MKKKFPIYSLLFISFSKAWAITEVCNYYTKPVQLPDKKQTFLVNSRAESISTVQGLYDANMKSCDTRDDPVSCKACYSMSFHSDHSVLHSCHSGDWNYYWLQSIKSCRNLNENNGYQPCSSGNPIAISNGNKFQIELEFTGPITFKRYYNSNLERWTNSFSSRVIKSNSNSQLIYLFRPDGRAYSFSKVTDKWVSNSKSYIELTENVNSFGWVVKLDDQSKEYFSTEGRLLKKDWKNGRYIQVSYNKGATLIRDELGNVLNLSYVKDKLVVAELNNITKFLYNYDSLGRLESVHSQSKGVRQYHYENEKFPYHLTGITDENGVRFATWTYDDQGRAITSEHAGGKEKVTLEFHDNNSTTVTNPLGKKTTYYFQKFNGVNKVVKVEGHQSQSCAAANKEYSYYPNGLLKTKTDWKGNVTEYKYNDQGLQTEKTEAVGTSQARTVTTEWDVDKRLPIKTSDGQLNTLYQYDDKGQLIQKTQQSFGK
ncbi:RHS repeat protein [Spartinivicinus ruber]|uniref:RHS repeat protein n=1 Tax=Spartinivicinus ruber TaxID=2683272 RepID=UPI0013D7DAB0|nr:RHS repeat protein [Spartinivicinus ruber]